MLQSQIRNFKIGLIVFMFVVPGGMFLYMRFTQERMIQSAREAEPRQIGLRTKRLEEIRQLSYQDPDAALKRADEITRSIDNDNERRQLREMLPEMLSQAATKHLEAGRRDAARPYRERLERQFPAASEVTRLRGTWHRRLAQEAVQSLSGGDSARRDAAYRELWDARLSETDTAPYDRLAQSHLKRWREAAAGDSPAQTEGLVAAARIITTSHRIDELARVVRERRLEAAALAALGDAEARGSHRHGALALWHAALETTPQESSPDREKLAAALRRKIAAGWNDLGDRLRQGERPAYVVLSPRDAYQFAAATGRGQVEEMEALTRRIDFEAAEATRAAATITQVALARLTDPAKLSATERAALEAAAERVREIVSSALQGPASRLWVCCLETPGFDPWPNVPADVRESLDGRPEKDPRPPADDAARRRQLATYYQKNYMRVPLGEVEPLRAVLHQTYARWGQLSLRGTPDHAFSLLREVLREAADSALRADVVQTLRGRLVQARESSDFETFFLLAGFYAGEVGLPAPGDPFRTEFRRGLEAAVKTFKEEGAMKRIFILSLLAQCFPDEPVGRDALRDAAAGAFKLVANVSPQKPDAIPLPSTLPGHAVHLINNSTEHHLLAFYRGAGLVMVHYWPWRRGTVVLPEGDYEIVVLSPSSSIRPYREATAKARGTRLSEYIVKTEGRDPAREYRSFAGGDYTLLHAPASLGAIRIEPRSGFPFRAK